MFLITLATCLSRSIGLASSARHPCSVTPWPRDLQAPNLCTNAADRGLGAVIPKAV